MQPRAQYPARHHDGQRFNVQLQRTRSRFILLEADDRAFIRIVPEGNTQRFGTISLNSLEALRAKVSTEIREAGDISAGTRQTVDELCCNRIGVGDHYDRNRLGRMLAARTAVRLPVTIASTLA